MSAVAAGDQKQKQGPQAQGPQSSQKQASSQSPELVKQAQQKLSATGHNAGPADGKMGPKTQAALKQFQQSKGLQASGQLDQKTIAALGVNAGASTSASASADKSADKTASAGGSAGKSSSASAGASSAPASPAGSASERTAEPKPGGAGPAAGGQSSEKSKY